MNGLSSVAAQEVQGDGVEAGGLIEIAAYVCENNDRAGEIDFILGGQVAAEAGDCRLATADEFSFTLYSDENGAEATDSTDDFGIATFSGGPGGEYWVTEDDSGTSTEKFTIEENGYVSITFILYSESVQVEEPLGGQGYLQIEHKICTDDARAGETDFFGGASEVVKADTLFCELGVGTVFTVETVEAEPTSVDAAGAPPVFVTDSDGLTDETNTLAAGAYQVTEDANGATSDPVSVPGFGSYTLVTVIDYIAGEADPASLTIHKAECETGVGPDIFETCHDNTVEDVTFSINGTDATTDADGEISLEVAAGTVDITEDAASFDEVLGGYVYCSEQATGDVLFDGDTQDGSVSIDAAAGDEIICDWYNITAASTDDNSGNTDDEEDDSTGGVTTLPNTGAGTTAPVTGGLLLAIGLLSVVALAGIPSLQRQRG